MRFSEAILTRLVFGIAMSVCMHGLGSAEMPESKEQPTGMVWIAGGEFSMGMRLGARPIDEKPMHRVCLDGFWMEATEVTNAQFRQFVEATSYVTTPSRPRSSTTSWRSCRRAASRRQRRCSCRGRCLYAALGRPRRAAGSGRRGQTATSRRALGAASRAKNDHRWCTPPGSMPLRIVSGPVNACRPRQEWEYAARGGLEDQPYVWGEDNPRPRAGAQTSGRASFRTRTPGRWLSHHQPRPYLCAERLWPLRHGGAMPGNATQDSGIGPTLMPAAPGEAAVVNPEGPDSSSP